MASVLVRLPQLVNIDFKANPTASEKNALSVRPDNCGCHQTVCDYLVTVSSQPIEQIRLGGVYDGKEIKLPAESYPADNTGAAALQGDLNTLLDGLAESITVVNSDGDITITVIGSSIELTQVYASGLIDFTKTNCRAKQ